MKWLKLKAVKNINRQTTITVTSLALLLFCITASYGETTVTLTRQLPSEVNLSHIKRIAVIPFDNDRSSENRMAGVRAIHKQRGQEKNEIHLQGGYCSRDYSSWQFGYNL